MQDLKELYEEQAGIDRRILDLFLERMENCEKISQYRIETGGKLIDKSKDLAQMEKLMADLPEGYKKRGASEILTLLHSLGLKRQYQILEERSGSGRLPFIAVDDLDRENIRVVYQGVEGAYSHAAMCQFFGEDVSCFHVDKWRDAMEAIADGEADYAVLPIENSSAGIVADNYDLLIDFENYIVGEQIVKCEHVLMGLPGTSLDQIEEVYSHQQALSQCEQFLDDHSSWKRIPYPNTAMAARKVAREGIASHAAIGSAFAARRFGLEILADHIYYNDANSTRFIIVTNQRIFKKDAGKISICFEVPHTYGALYRIISHIIFNGLNMNLIESRPITGRNWEYHIFIDFDGNLSDSSVKTALRGIRSEAINMKILGNY